MSSAKDPFRGFQQRQIDSARRLRLPLAWVDHLRGQPILRLDHEKGMTCIQLLPASAMIESCEESDAPKGRLRTCKIDARGRMTLPQDFCEAASIDVPGNLIVAGRGWIIELWNAANFDSVLALEFPPMDSRNHRLTN